MSDGKSIPCIQMLQCSDSLLQRMTFSACAPFPFKTVLYSQSIRRSESGKNIVQYVIHSKNRTILDARVPRRKTGVLGEPPPYRRHEANFMPCCVELIQNMSALKS